MIVTVKLITGQTVDVEVAGPESPVEDIKLGIEKAVGVPVYQQRIIWAGKQLEDGRTCADYGITAEGTAVVHMVLAMRMGDMDSGRSGFEPATKPPQ